jgi:hypothetical protein
MRNAEHCVLAGDKRKRGSRLIWLTSVCALVTLGAFGLASQRALQTKAG